jgi:hypothetical protein
LLQPLAYCAFSPAYLASAAQPADTIGAATMIGEPD